MSSLFKLLAVAALALALTGAAPPATDIHINPMPPHFQPKWTPVPNAPGVYWEPRLPTDVFRYRGKYYFFWEGYLYRANKPSGPWKSILEAPDWFSKIDPSYFKTLKREAPVPPAGQPGGPAPPPPSTPPPWVPPSPPPTTPPPWVPPAPPAPEAAAPAPPETAAPEPPAVPEPPAAPEPAPAPPAPEKDEILPPPADPGMAPKVM
jgi:hypothetical protein